MNNIDYLHGRKVSFNYRDKKGYGKLCVKGNNVWICQNLISGANDSPDHLGYAHSWLLIGVESKENLLEKACFKFDCFKFASKEIEDIDVGDVLEHCAYNENKHKVIFRSGEFVVLKDMDDDSATTWSIKEIAETFRVPNEEENEQEVELTMDEIASKFNIPVEKLKIKKD